MLSLVYLNRSVPSNHEGIKVRLSLRVCVGPVTVGLARVSGVHPIGTVQELPAQNAALDADTPKDDRTYHGTSIILTTLRKAPIIGVILYLYAEPRRFSSNESDVTCD